MFVTLILQKIEDWDVLKWYLVNKIKKFKQFNNLKK